VRRRAAVVAGIDVTPSVIPGLDPGIHVFGVERFKAWMAGTGPAMTIDEVLSFHSNG
jgi:hypothetical protein